MLIKLCFQDGRVLGVPFAEYHVSAPPQRSEVLIAPKTALDTENPEEKLTVRLYIVMQIIWDPAYDAAIVVVTPFQGMTPFPASIMASAGYRIA